MCPAGRSLSFLLQLFCLLFFETSMCLSQVLLLNTPCSDASVYSLEMYCLLFCSRWSFIVQLFCFLLPDAWLVVKCIFPSVSLLKMCTCTHTLPKNYRSIMFGFFDFTYFTNKKKLQAAALFNPILSEVAKVLFYFTSSLQFLLVDRVPIIHVLVSYQLCRQR